MIVLHLSLYEDRLLLWGEQNSDEKKPTKSKPSLKQTAPRPHPFACSHFKLASILSEQNVSSEIESHGDLDTDKVPGKDIHTLNVQAVMALPAINNFPLYSMSEPLDEAKIETFMVPAVSFTTKSLISILAKVGSKRMLAPGIALAPEFSVVRELTRLAVRIVVSQQFLPSVRAVDDGYIAEWTPVWSASDRSFFHNTAQKAPAVLRAAIGLKGKGKPGNPLNGVTGLQQYVGELVDYFVRNSLSERQRAIQILPRARQSKGQTSASIHDAWISALTNKTSKYIEYDKTECEKLRRQVAEWQRPITVLKSSPFRLCFRLDEPEEDAKKKKGTKADTNAASWQISYHLQSQHDQSLILPVEKVWQNDPNSAAVFKRENFNPREYLLIAFGHASKLYQYVEKSLSGSSPSNFNLDIEGAYQFLSEQSLVLESAGFGVLLPSWWVAGQSKDHLKLKAKTKSTEAPAFKTKAGLGAETIIKFDYEVAIGNHVLSFDELNAIAQLKTPLVKIRGKWVHIDPVQVKQAVKYWDKKGGSASLKDLVGVSIGAKDSLFGANIFEVEATGWVQALLKQIQDPSKVSILNAPVDLTGTLRPYQLCGYSWISFLKDCGFGACLADDMGLGKTIQTLAMIQNDREISAAKREKECKPILLICPTSVVNNWVRESKKFTPTLRLLVHHGTGRSKESKFLKQAQQADIVISSYALLHRDIAHLRNVEWDGVVLDEAQNIKNSSTKQARAAKSLKSDFRLALTGTPVENNVGDLWSLMDFLNPGMLGGQEHFRKTFFRPIQYLDDANARVRLKRITQPFILRRLKTDKTIIQDLPDKQESKVYCLLTKEQGSLYQAVLEDFLERMSSVEDYIERSGLVLATLSKLKQVCNHPTQFLGDNSPVPERSGKLARLREIMEEIMEAREKVLIFTQFTKMGALLKTYLEDQFGYPVLFLHGGVEKQARDEMVERFQTGNASPIFLLSLKAGGTGLNLNAANHVIHFDRWWNPAVENQATDRAFRIGQKKNVQVHKFVCAGTLEEKIDDMIESKQKIASSVIGSGEAWLAELSTVELSKVFALSKDAIAE